MAFSEGMKSDVIMAGRGYMPVTTMGALQYCLQVTQQYTAIGTSASHSGSLPRRCEASTMPAVTTCLSSEAQAGHNVPLTTAGALEPLT